MLNDGVIALNCPIASRSMLPAVSQLVETHQSSISDNDNIGFLIQSKPIVVYNKYEPILNCYPEG